MRELLMNIVPAICISFLVQLLFHETGHLMGGLLTGWRLLYLQFYHIALVKDKKSYKIKLVSTNGYQCMMYPVVLNNHSTLYTIGGCIFNLLGAFVGITGMLLLKNEPIGWMYSWCFFVVGIVLFLFNSIPNTNRICNDGACYQLLKGNTQTKRYHNLQFIIAKQLYEGVTYKDIGKTLICLPPIKVDNDILAYQAVLEYYYWLELEEYELMKNALEKVDMTSPISQNVKDIILMERLYCDVLLKMKWIKDPLEGLIMDLMEEAKINPKADPKADSMDTAKYEGDILKYIKSHETKGDVHSKRIITIYELYKCMKYQEDQSALSIIDGAIHQLNNINCIYSGEALFCIRQLEKLRGYIGVCNRYDK